MSMFLATVILLPLAAVVLTAVLPWVEGKAMRIGLWMNGVTGERQDDVVHYWKTGRLRR